MLEKWMKKNAFAIVLRLLPVTIPATLTDALMLLGIRSFIQLLDKNTDWSILEWFFCMILVVFLRFLFLKIRCEVSEHFFRQKGASLQGWFLKSIRSLHPDFFHDPTADAKLRSTFEATEILPKCGESFYQTLQAIVQLVVFFPLLFWISTPLTLFLFGCILPFVIIGQKKIRQLGVEEKETLLEVGVLRSEFEKAKDVYRHWSDQSERNIVGTRIFQKIRRYFVIGKNLAIKKNLLSLGVESISVVAMLLVLSACAYLIHAGQMNGEHLVLYASAVFLCYKPIKECAKAFPQLRSASIAYHLLKELENYPKRKPYSNYNDSLKLENVSFAYGEVSVFENFSFDLLLKAERPIFLHGENGIGKSSLLRLITNLEEIKNGNLSLPIEAKDGVFFFSQNLYMPSIEFFEPKFRKENLNLKGKSIQEFFKLAEIEPLLKKKEHSGGEKARLALFLALISDSKLLLLDEIFAYISVKKRESLLPAFLKAAKEEKKIVILSGHNELPKNLSEMFMHLTLKKNEVEVST